MSWKWGHWGFHALNPSRWGTVCPERGTLSWTSPKRVWRKNRIWNILGDTSKGVLSLCIPQTAAAAGYLQETGTNTHLHCKYLHLGRRVQLSPMCTFSFMYQRKHFSPLSRDWTTSAREYYKELDSTLQSTEVALLCFSCLCNNSWCNSYVDKDSFCSEQCETWVSGSCFFLPFYFNYLWWSKRPGCFSSCAVTLRTSALNLFI